MPATPVPPQPSPHHHRRAAISGWRRVWEADPVNHEVSLITQGNIVCVHHFPPKSATDADVSITPPGRLFCGGHPRPVIAARCPRTMRGDLSINKAKRDGMLQALVA